LEKTRIPQFCTAGGRWGEEDIKKAWTFKKRETTPTSAPKEVKLNASHRGGKKAMPQANWTINYEVEQGGTNK